MSKISFGKPGSCPKRQREIDLVEEMRYLFLISREEVQDGRNLAARRDVGDVGLADGPDLSSLANTQGGQPPAKRAGKR